MITTSLSSTSARNPRQCKTVPLLTTHALGLTSLVLLGLAAPPSASAQQYAAPTVVMSGLANPHGLTFGPDGSLYVAEAGTGGSGPSILSGDGSTVSYGLTGGISRLMNGVQTQIVAGLPSLAATGGGGSTGLYDLAFNGSSLYGVMGLGADPNARNSLVAGGASGDAFGQFVSFDLNGGTRQNVADLAAYEETNNPDGTDLSSNPYSMALGPNGSFGVADAGGNDLLNVDPTTGKISVLAVFPDLTNTLPYGPPTVQAVPDAVTLGPDGFYYVGELTGGPFPPGAADIYRVNPTTGAFTVAATGFTNIGDLAFSPNGDLNVLELSENGLAASSGPVPGALFSVDLASGTKSLIDQNLAFPTGITVGKDGSLYVVNDGTSPNGGEVLRFAPTPEPSSIAGLGLGILGLAGLALRARKRNVSA